MTVPKQQIIDMINNFPEQVDIEEILYRLYLKEKIELAEKDVTDGNLISHEDLIKETDSWFQK